MSITIVPEFRRTLLRRTPGFLQIWQLVALLVSIALAGVYAYVAISRITYPYILEFTEDSLLMQALRVASGQPAFVPPSASYVPQSYMPLFTWLGGQLFKLTGPGLAPLRLLSTVATVATAILIGWITKRESRSWVLALVGASLYLSGYRIVGGWTELARVDSLMVLLLTAGTATALYWWQTQAGLLMSGILLALALLTKQQAVAIGLVMAGFLLVTVGRRAWWFVASYVLVAGIPTLVLQIRSQGWFLTYMGNAFASPLDWRRIPLTLGVEFFGAMGVLTALFLMTLTLAFRLHGRRVFAHQPWLLFVGTALLISVAGRTSVGGDRNNLMPAYAFLCLAPALFWQVIPSVRPGTARVYGMVLLALLAQFALTAWNPIYGWIGHQRMDSFVPDPELRAAGDRFIERIAAISGPVWVMVHPYYALQAGKDPGVHLLPLWHARDRGEAPLPADLVRRLEGRYYAAIISDGSQYFETDPQLTTLLETHYQLSERLDQSEAPATINGFLVRPRAIYVPRRGPLAPGEM